MLEALRSTPVTLWMPPLAWGNARSYSRYVRLLLNREESDGLPLTAAQRRKVVTLRPSVSFSVWKYFRPNAGADGGSASDGNESDDAGPFSERSNTHDRPTTATTGFKFFLLAMGLCDDVSLFGFEDDPGTRRTAAEGTSSTRSTARRTRTTSRGNGGKCGGTRRATACASSPRTDDEFWGERHLGPGFYGATRRQFFFFFF